jgi:hypothetical protein
LGLILITLGRYHEAITYHEKALAIDQKILGEENTSVVTDYNNLGAAWDNLIY